MTTKPRRWFSFSLRTMFVVVTALCCGLAWEMSIVRQRKVELRSLQTVPGVQVLTAETWLQLLSPGPVAPKMATIPRVREWLGDEAIQEISYDPRFHQHSKSDLSRIQRIFPEAELRETPLPLEPCHPGCFPRGTLVETPQGPRPIESVQPGDALVTILPDGQTVTANVQSVFVTKNRLWKVETEEGDLLTTQTQPLCVAAAQRNSFGSGSGMNSVLLDRTVRAGDLQRGDYILRSTGGEIHAVQVRQVSRTDRTEKVFNLVIGDCEVFIAGGFLARSKPPAEVAAR